MVLALAPYLKPYPQYVVLAPYLKPNPLYVVLVVLAPYLKPYPLYVKLGPYLKPYPLYVVLFGHVMCEAFVERDQLDILGPEDDILGTQLSNVRLDYLEQLLFIIQFLEEQRKNVQCTLHVVPLITVV